MNSNPMGSLRSPSEQNLVEGICRHRQDLFCLFTFHYGTRYLYGFRANAQRLSGIEWQEYYFFLTFLDATHPRCQMQLLVGYT